jgi:hypothetical protein
VRSYELYSAAYANGQKPDGFYFSHGRESISLDFTCIFCLECFSFPKSTRHLESEDSYCNQVRSSKLHVLFFIFYRTKGLTDFVFL